MNRITPELLSYCETNAQYRAVQSVIDHGSIAQAAQAEERDERNLRRMVKSVEAHAARKGWAPDNGLAHPLPEGFTLKGVSTLYDEDGNVSSQWFKTREDRQKMKLLIEEAAQAASENVAPVSPVPAPSYADDDLLSVYILTDYHLGMLAWGEETGADWDTSIAEEALYEWFARAITMAPSGGRAVLANLGDFLHWDGLDAVTPTSGNILDADTRFQHLVRVAIRAIRRIVTLMLQNHSEVHVLMAEGNHDLASSIWLREMMAALYGEEPRVTVDQTATPYYCVEHGNTAVFFHHGHKRKPGDVAEVFAAKYREVFGRTTHAYCHLGHRHHRQLLENPLMEVEQHPTLAAPDSHASRLGYDAQRTASVITYHSRDGEISRVNIPSGRLKATA